MHSFGVLSFERVPLPSPPGWQRWKQFPITFQPRLVKTGPIGINSFHIFRLHTLACKTSECPSQGNGEAQGQQQAKVQAQAGHCCQVLPGRNRSAGLAWARCWPTECFRTLQGRHNHSKLFGDGIGWKWMDFEAKSSNFTPCLGSVTVPPEVHSAVVRETLSTMAARSPLCEEGGMERWACNPEWPCEPSTLHTMSTTYDGPFLQGRDWGWGGRTLGAKTKLGTRTEAGSPSSSCISAAE